MSSRLPIFHDNQSFHDRTEQMFRDMRLQMDRDMIGIPRSLNDWPPSNSGAFMNNDFMSGVGGPNRNFFQLQPMSNTTVFRPGEILDDSTYDRLIVDSPTDKSVGGNGECGRLFQMSFDVHDYNPQEVQVRIENDNCMIVEAKQIQTKDGSNMTREFSRKIQLPPGVAAEKITSTLSTDGILTVKAPVPPGYTLPKLQSNSTAQSMTQPGFSNSSIGPMPIPQPSFKDPVSQGFLSNSPVFQSGLRSSPLTIQSMVSPMMPQPPPFSNIFNQQRGSGAGTYNQGVLTIPVLSHPPPNLNTLACRDRPQFTAVENGRRKRMDLILDFGRQYGPNDIVVKLNGTNRLTIDASREEKDQFGKVSKSTSQKEYELVERIDPATITALMKEDGFLTINAHTHYN